MGRLKLNVTLFEPGLDAPVSAYPQMSCSGKVIEAWSDAPISTAWAELAGRDIALDFRPPGDSLVFWDRGGKSTVLSLAPPRGVRNEGLYLFVRKRLSIFCLELVLRLETPWGYPDDGNTKISWKPVARILFKEERRAYSDV